MMTIDPATTTAPALRPMTDADLPRVVALCRELGYDVSEAAVAGRFARLGGRPDTALMVAADEADRPQGFVHVLEKAILEGPSEAQVQALVVAGDPRGDGLGTALLDWAETWARKRGLARVTLSSQTHHEAAHAFYQERGYQTVTQCYGFAKDLY